MKTFKTPTTTGTVSINTNTGVFTITGTTSCKALRYIAATPPDFRDSYASSALPFPTQQIAFENTRNKGTVTISPNGQFTFTLIYPNSYYINGGSTLVLPYVLITGDNNEQIRVSLGDHIFENRSLTSAPGKYKRSTGLGSGTRVF